MSLAELREGTPAKVVALNGGIGFVGKLESLGIRIGIVIVKKSAQIMKGPINIQVGNTEVAMGFGMAQKIIVEPV